MAMLVSGSVRSCRNQEGNGNRSQKQSNHELYIFLGNHEIFPVGIPTNQAAKIMWPGI